MAGVAHRLERLPGAESPRPGSVGRIRRVVPVSGRSSRVSSGAYGVAQALWRCDGPARRGTDWAGLPAHAASRGRTAAGDGAHRLRLVGRPEGAELGDALLPLRQGLGGI